MIEEMKEIFELATSATVFVKNILDLKPNNKNSEENEIVISNKNYNAKIGSSGDYAKIGSSGYNAKIGSSGYNAKIGSSGDYAKIGSSGDYAQIGSSGDYAQIGSSGDYAKIGSSGDYAKIGSSGDYAKIDSTGNKAVISAIGPNSIAKGKVGSWITLAEYKVNKDSCWEVDFIKTEQIDGVKIKEDTYYALHNKEFREAEEIDNTLVIIEKRHKNIIKGVFLNDKSNCIIFSKDGINAHGKTIKQAYRDWLFKTSDRDVSQYEDISKAKKYDLNFWVIAYRTITGACSLGTENFLENNKEKYEAKMTLKEVLKATEGQYGHNTFKEFFERK